jgi:hypothetical protein
MEEFMTDAATPFMQHSTSHTLDPFLSYPFMPHIDFHLPFFRIKKMLTCPFALSLKKLISTKVVLIYRVALQNQWYNN